MPAAFVAYEGLRLLRGERRVWRRAVASGAAAATLLGWIAFFGGLAPKAGMDVWVPRYPAPMLEWSGFIVHYGLYSLAGIGAYFVLLEAILFREIPTRKDLVKPRHLVLALVLGVLFVWDPPVLTASHPGGPIGRISRILFPPPAFDFVRVGMYYLLALAAVLRFSLRVDAASWIVLAGAVLSMKQQIPWEKYLMPTLACLWLLRAAGELLPYGAGAASRSASKGLTTTPDSSASQRVNAAFIAGAEKEFAKFIGRGIALAVPEVPLEARQELLTQANHYGFLRVSSFTSGELKDHTAITMLAQTDLISINIDEAVALIGENITYRSLEAIVQTTFTRLNQLNPSIQATITAGRRRSWGYEEQQFHDSPALPIQVVNTAGAGDALLAGLIVARVVRLEFEQAMELATLIAGYSTTSRENRSDLNDQIPLSDAGETLEYRQQRGAQTPAPIDDANC